MEMTNQSHGNQINIKNKHSKNKNKLWFSHLLQLPEQTDQDYSSKKHYSSWSLDSEKLVIKYKIMSRDYYVLSITVMLYYD